MSIDVSAATRSRPDAGQVACLAGFLFDLLVGGPGDPVTIDEDETERDGIFFVETTHWNIRRGPDLALLPGLLALNPVCDPDFELDGLWDLTLQPFKTETPEQVLLTVVTLLAVAILGDGFIYDDLKALFPARIVTPSQLLRAPIFTGTRSAGEALFLLGVKERTLTEIYHGMSRWGEPLTADQARDLLAGTLRGYRLLGNRTSHDPEALVESIQQTIERWRRSRHPSEAEIRDLGLVFGEQVRRAYGWHWVDLHWNTSTWREEGQRGSDLALTPPGWEVAIRPGHTVEAELHRPDRTPPGLLARFQRITEHVHASASQRYRDELFALFDERS